MRRALALVVLAACGPTLTIHERAAPRRVDVKKQATEPRVELTARSLGGDSIELVAKRTSEIKLTRVVHYAATTIKRKRSNPLLELIEIPVGLFLLIGGPGAWETPYRIPETRTTKPYTQANWIVGFLSPGQTLLSYRTEIDASSEAEVFADDPVVRQFQVRLPAPGLPGPYRVLDEAERPIASGNATTDAFGRVTIEKVPGAIAVEVWQAGQPVVLAIEEALP
jgi:hypothetical protein